MGTQIKNDGGCFGGEAGENRWYKIIGGGGYCYKKYGTPDRGCNTVCIGAYLPFDDFWVGGVAVFWVF